jgi:ABC-type sugar transport system ATPase subunit
MMFVGHRMDEIYRIADRIAVLRDGHLVGTELAFELTHARCNSWWAARLISSIRTTTPKLAKSCSASSLETVKFSSTRLSFGLRSACETCSRWTCVSTRWTERSEGAQTAGDTFA